MTNEQDQAAVVNQLAPLFPIITETVQRSVVEATDFFRNRGEPTDRNMFPHLVRYFLKHHLAAAGQHAEYEPADPQPLFEERVLANNGILLVVEPYEIRVWKADQGRIPPIGQSRRRRDFCNQVRAIGDQTQLFGAETFEASESRAIALNLVVLWNVSDKYDLVTIDLVCPMPSAAEVSAVEEEWRHSIFYAVPTSAAMSATADEIVEDLDVTPKRGQQGEVERAQ